MIVAPRVATIAIMIAIVLAGEITEGETSAVAMMGVAGEFLGDSVVEVSVSLPNSSGVRSRPHSGGVEKPWAGVWSLTGAKVTS
jgi:hypothetical protein